MANYRDIYNRLAKYTDNFTKDGKLPFESKDEIENAKSILKKRYNKVNKKGLDYDNSDINGADYVVSFEESLLDSEGGLTYIPDKSPENAKLINGQGGEASGDGASLSESFSDSLPSFNELTYDQRCYILDKQKIERDKFESLGGHITYAEDIDDDPADEYYARKYRDDIIKNQLRKYGVAWKVD